MCQRAKVYLMVILLLSYASGAAAFAGNNLQEMKVLYREIKVLINGKELKSSVQPFMIENSGPWSLRAMAEALQQEVIWRGDQGIVEIKSKTTFRQNDLPSEKPASIWRSYRC